jgi:hypothetical protein
VAALGDARTSRDLLAIFEDDGDEAAGVPGVIVPTWSSRALTRKVRAVSAWEIVESIALPKAPASLPWTASFTFDKRLSRDVGAADRDWDVGSLAAG